MTYQNFNQPSSVAPSGTVAPSTLLLVSQDEIIRNYPHTKRVGGYLLGRTIGEGSFAKVKEGIHVLTGEKVAVKIIDKKKAKEDAYVRRNLRREGRLLQQVRHHNIIQLFETLETENSYYIVTEHCGGGDLMSRICSRKRLDEAETRKYIRQIVSAVDYLHKAGILHRDLKVENLLLDEKKDIKIIDFGLSNSFRSSDSKESSGLADELCVTQCGSPAYAAPELLNNSKYGPKVDIWSIGVNMYAMLTGNLPFTVDPFTIKSLHNKMINGDMNPIPEHLSKNCKELLKRFLTADPEQRISLQDAMQHGWITDGRNKPIEVAPYPNRLTAVDLNQTVLKHMATQLDFKLGEVLRQVTANIPCGSTSTYHLLLRKLSRYREGVTKGVRPAALPRSDTIVGVRKTPRELVAVQQREFLPTNPTPSNAQPIDIDQTQKTTTGPTDHNNDDPDEVTTPPLSKTHPPGSSPGSTDPFFTLPFVPSSTRLSHQKTISNPAPAGRTVPQVAPVAVARCKADEVGTVPRPRESSVGGRSVRGFIRRELVVESISDDEATDEEEDEKKKEEVVDEKGFRDTELTMVPEKAVVMSEDNNNNNKSDDNSNNDEKCQVTNTHQRLDSNAVQTNYRHLANDSPTPSSPMTDDRTSGENKENRLKLAKTVVQPNRKGVYSRTTDVKFIKLTQLNTHASVPPQPSHVTEEALFDLSPQSKGQSYDSHNVGREPAQRPISDLPLIPRGTGQYVTNTWTLANQRTRPGATLPRGEGVSRAATTSRQPSRTVAGSRSTPSGCGGRSSRGTEALFLAPLVKAEVTSVPVKATAKRYVIDVDHYERNASRDRRAMFFTPRPHQWRAGQVKPLTATNPGGGGGSLTERRRTTNPGRVASTEEDGRGVGLGRAGVRITPGEKKVKKGYSIGNEDYSGGGDRFSVEIDSKQLLP